MRFMIQVRATVTTELGARPPAHFAKLVEEMGAFHEEMARAGVLLDGAGLRPLRSGWRQHYRTDGRIEHVDGPYAEAKELIAGYTLIQVKSREEALAWSRRFPNPMPGEDCCIEVRQLYEEADFLPGGDMSPTP